MARDSPTDRARRLRQRSTDAERVLWARLRGRGLQGVKFRRQARLGLYFVDFLSEEARLIVELDGGQHLDQRQSDDRRTRWLESRGFKVLRFWNHDVFQRLDSVLEAIRLTLEERLPDGERRDETA